MATPGSGDTSSSNPRPVAGGRGSMLNLRVPGRLPAMRSRDLTLGGVKKVRLSSPHAPTRSHRDTSWFLDLVFVYCVCSVDLFTPNLLTMEGSCGIVNIRLKHTPTEGELLYFCHVKM